MGLEEAVTAKAPQEQEEAVETKEEESPA